MTNEGRPASDDELLDRIQKLIDLLVNEPALERHERANAANQIVLCASVLHKRLKEREQM